MRKFRSHNYNHCLNCNTPMTPEARFCSQCSQPRTDGKHSVWVLIRDFIESTFNLDARFLRSLYRLLNPAALTMDYFAGKQIRYWQPLRLFLIMAAIQLAVFSTGLNDFLKGLNEGTGGNRLEENLKTSIQYKELDSLRQYALSQKNISKSENRGINYLLNQFAALHNSSDMSRKQAKNDSLYHVVIDSLTRNKLPIDTAELVEEYKNRDFVSNIDIKSDSFDLTMFALNVKLNEDTILNKNKKKIIKVAKKDILEMEPSQLMDHYKVEGFWKRIIMAQGVKMITSSKSLFQFLFEKISWMLILLMPFVALLLELLNRRRLYFEHLVFSFHVHAFVFLIGSVLFLLSHFVGHDNYVGTAAGITFAGALTYLFIAMKRFYNQSYLKTSFKYIILLMSYFFVSLVFCFCTFVLSFMFF
jgi:hypothetical protein